MPGAPLSVIPGSVKGDVIRSNTGYIPQIPGAPGRPPVQSQPGFAALPREYQKRVESGDISLLDAIDRSKADRSYGSEAGTTAPAASASVPGKAKQKAAQAANGPKTDTGFDIGGSQKEGLDVDSVVQKWFTSILDGSVGSFTKEKEALMVSDITEAANQKKIQLKQQEQQRGISRGLFRSGLQLQAERDIDLAMEQEKSQGIRQVKLARLQAEFTDKMSALQLAQSWLDSKRRYELGKEQIQATREATRAQIGLGYAQIAAQKEIAQMQAGRAGAALALDRERFEFSKQMALQEAEDRHMTTLFQMAGGL